MWEKFKSRKRRQWGSFSRYAETRACQGALIVVAVVFSALVATALWPPLG